MFRLSFCRLHHSVQIMCVKINKISSEQIGFPHLERWTGVAILIHTHALVANYLEYGGVLGQVVGVHAAYRVDPLKKEEIILLPRCVETWILRHVHTTHSCHRLGIAALVIGSHIGQGVHSAGAHPLEAGGVGGGEHISVPTEHAWRITYQTLHPLGAGPEGAVLKQDRAIFKVFLHRRIIYGRIDIVIAAIGYCGILGIQSRQLPPEGRPARQADAGEGGGQRQQQGQQDGGPRLAGILLVEHGGHLLKKEPGGGAPPPGCSESLKAV